LGLQYNEKSELIIDRFQGIMAGATIGRRFPSVEVLRFMDWLPTNTLDIIGYSMKYTLLVFPGNTTEPSIKQLCKDFLFRLSNKERASFMVKVSLILHVTKDDSHLGFLEYLGDTVGAKYVLKHLSSQAC
jgi:phenol 2-monooxygenase